MHSSSYAIITQSVGDMGGSQLYTLRRLKHLVSQGKTVYIVTGSKNNFILEKEFTGIDIFVVPEINYLPPFYTSGKVKKINDKIFDFLREKNVSVLESHSLATSVYAEVAAEKLSAKHIIYLLNEDKVKNEDGKGYSGFFDFKLNRKELFGVSSISLSIILSKEISKEDNKYINIPFDTSEINETNVLPEYNFNEQDYDFKIFTISRLDKAYVRNLITDTIKVAKKYNEKKILLMIIGDSSNPTIIESLKKIDSTSENLKIVFTGYWHPVPSSIFRKMDLFVGMGTASINSISQKCATAVIDPRDSLSSGFLGIDTNNFAYPEKDKPNIKIEDVIEKVIIDNLSLQNAATSGHDLFKKSYESNTVMNFFDAEIRKSSSEKKYWKFSFNRSPRRKIEFLLINIIGTENYDTMFPKVINFATKLLRRS